MQDEKRRAPARAPYLAGLAFYIVFILRGAFQLRGKPAISLFDDGMISMQYARNLAHGHGLVWNAGRQAVEGITNPLWALVMTVPHLLAVPDGLTSLWVVVLGCALQLGCIALASDLARRVAPGDTAAATRAAWLVAFCYPLIYWTLRGMEVGLVAFGVLALADLVLRTERSPRRRDVVLLATTCVVLVSTRIDTAVFVAVAVVYLVSGARRTSARVAALTAGAATAAALVVQELWRWVTYGALVPNTYELKVGHVGLFARVDRGGRALFVTVMLSLLVALVCAIAALVRRRDAHVDLLAALAAGAGAYSVYVGGDAWEWMRYANRYVTPAVVILCVLAAIGCNDVVAIVRETPRVGRALVAMFGAATVVVAYDLLPRDHNLLPAGQHVAIAAAAIAPLAGAAALLLVTRGNPPAIATRLGLATVLAIAVGVAMDGPALLGWAKSNAADVRTDADNVRFGQTLGAVTTSNARIGVVAAGAPIYFAHREGVDLLGKSDTRIAAEHVRPEVGFWPGHSKWDYFVSIVHDRPDVVAQLWHPSPAEGAAIFAAGYVPMRPTAAITARYGDGRPILVLRGSSAVRWDRLEAAPDAFRP